MTPPTTTTDSTDSGTTDTVRAVDLFCGAGGISTGLALACESLDRDVELVAVNHWTTAIETHQQNHEWADHRNVKVEELHPPDVAPAGEVDILVAAPECTDFSRAKGGKPVTEQKRASPWHVVDWAQKLRPENILIENVPDLEDWGPLDEHGKPIRNGEIFDAWVNALHSLGYSVDWRVLNAADYGDATSRKRLFVVGRLGKRAEFPAPTHSENGAVPGTDAWRPASEIIDWSDLGSSIWTRDLERPLVHSPPGATTLSRIAEGVRRLCSEEVVGYADVLDGLTPEDIVELREDVVDAENAHEVATERDQPFLVCGPAAVHESPEQERIGLNAGFLLGQQSGATPRSVAGKPCPTIATKGAISISTPESFILPRNGLQRDENSNPAYFPEDRPLHVVTAMNHDGHLVSPFLIEYYGNSDARSLEEPLPTVTTKDRFALVVPDLYPYGLDVGFRMLQPRELAAAMGFPGDYEFSGNKGDTVEQIGNAVPVNLARALCRQLLVGDAPSLTSFTEHDPAEALRGEADD